MRFSSAAASAFRRQLRTRTPLTPHTRSFSVTPTPTPPFIDFDLMANLFTFVDELAHDKQALVAQSRETLRQMGRADDIVRLHLPYSAAASTIAKPTSGVASEVLAYLGLDTLQKAAVIEIHNPSARNALSGKMMAELADIVTKLEDPQVHANLNTVILKGTDGWFCAGADLRVAQKQLTSNEAGTAMGALMVDTLTRFRRLPFVSFAIVEGGAYGGGAELATSCDYRLIEKKAIVQFVQARMGVSPGWGGGARLYKLVGRQHALRLLCTGAKISPEEAVALGLADLVFDAEIEVSDKKILDFVAAFDQVESEVLHGQKKVITNADDVSLDDLVDYEHGVFKSLWGGPANLRALESFKKKTPSPRAQPPSE